MFHKILIANRGEIACRVIKTAKRMGIATVSVYSDADANALHVKHADEAVHIGPAPSRDSYLSIEKIITACKQTGADAVHPGYGFLSENAKFADALAKEDIAFIGPPINAIEIMGDKITSKKQANAAGVSTVPGYMGLVETPEQGRDIATEIGYPVMIKASAGGGGKGMRIAWSNAEIEEGIARAKSEAASSFGDDRLFIEKFITNPRHIEIQILADNHDNIIHLGERECSIQRRNQKVIEEAPSPFVDSALRETMGEQAIALARSVDYKSAGTVEFIMDQEHNFYFLEMNTRLQVEHPVTELITGIDLVEQMIKVAAGEALSFRQSDVTFKGWAIESRVYAENPYRNFLPSTGRLLTYNPPHHHQDDKGCIVRNDTGVYEGAEISTYYDPMIAKLCTWAPDRTNAIEKMLDALDEFEVEGIANNIPFLSALINHQAFRDGALTTGFIETHYKGGFEGVAIPSDIKDYLAQTACVLKYIEMQRMNVTGPNENQQQQCLAIKTEDTAFECKVHYEAPHYIVSTKNNTIPLNVIWSLGQRLTQISLNDQKLTLRVNKTTTGYILSYRGSDVSIDVLPPHIMKLMALMPEKQIADTSNLLLCPMPGCVTSVLVKEGDQVEPGQGLAIVEAMKMENMLKAERQAVVKKICIEPNTTLNVDDVIMEFE
ncbi:MAG: acetyl/propionyl/methylcrotonyl-CoA carboxylase subunit alpha [Pseudomonadota bacterium]